MDYLCPEALVKGDTIGLVTPSSPTQNNRLQIGVQYLEQKGYKTKIGSYNLEADRFLAGPDISRAADIMNFFKDPSVKAILATGGGYGTQRILPFLDMGLIRANPKWIIGFSDTTSLQLAVLSKAGIASCTGFTCRDLENYPLDNFLENTLFTCLSNNSYQINDAEMVTPGVVEGPLLGGNLECISALMGTPYQPSFKNCILFLEETHCEPYKIDSKLVQLEQAGVFNQIKGLIWGTFFRCEAAHFPERDGTVDDIITEWSTRASVPCIKAFPYGHQNRRCVLPIGKKALLNADDKTLNILAGNYNA